MGSIYVQLKEAFFFPPESFFFAGFFQYLFPCSAIQRTARNFDSYCFMVQRNLTGATLMTAQSLPTSTASPPASPLPSQHLERRGALRHRRGETPPHAWRCCSSQSCTHPGRCTGLREGNQTPFLLAPEVDSLQLQEATAKQLLRAIMPACKDTVPQGAGDRAAAYCCAGHCFSGTAIHGAAFYPAKLLELERWHYSTSHSKGLRALPVCKQRKRKQTRVKPG